MPQVARESSDGRRVTRRLHKSGGSERGAAAITGAVVAVAGVVGLLTAVQPSAAAAVAGGMLLLALLRLLSTRRAFSPPIDLAGKRFRWIALAWAYVMIRPIGHYTVGRSSLAAVAGSASPENVADIALHAGIAALAIWSIRVNRLRVRAPWLILALPVLSLLSAAWSIAPTVTLGFSFELLATALLAMVTAAIYDADRELGHAVICRSLRVIVQLVVVLCLVGFMLPHVASQDLSTDTQARFTWPGVQTLTATAEIGFAMLVVLFGTRKEIGFRGPTRIVLLALFATCLYLGKSRTAWLGLAAALLFGYWFISRGRGPARRLAGGLAIGAILALIIASFGGSILQYLYRGESQAQVYGFNGRLGIWTFLLQQLHTPGQWFAGYGLGAVRVLVIQFVAWAGDAHSAWIELIASLGVLGLAAALALIVTLGVRLFRIQPEAPLATRALPILFVYLLAMSPVASGFAAPGPEPGLGFGLLALAYGATAFRARARSVALAGHRPLTDGASRYGRRREREFRPAPI